jgi:hypothetical protein
VLTLEEYLSIPYMLVAYSVRRPSGEWVRRAEYPEIGCTSEGATPLEAIDRLEGQRIRYILERVERNEAIPVPRPPLPARGSLLELARLGFGGWLTEHPDLSRG